MDGLRHFDAQGSCYFSFFYHYDFKIHHVFYYFNHCTAIKSKDNENIINIIILIVFLHFTQSVDHARICP